MNSEASERLGQLVKEITETGEWILEPQKLKDIKSFCKRSDFNVQATFELVMAQLKKKHAQIRYSCLQLIEQLFERSKHFRDLLTEDFPVFTQLTVGIQGHKLPAPPQVAVKLKEYAIALIKSWFTKFGERYRQLSIAYDYLLDNGFLNQEAGTLSSIHTNDRNKSSNDERRKVIQLNRYELLKADIDNQMDVIQDNLTNMEGCFEILIPKNEFIEEDMDFDALLRGEVNSDQAMDDNYKDNIMSHGLGSNRYKITIDMSEESLMEEIKETEDNKIVFDQLREAYTLLERKHTKLLNHWINTLIKLEIQDKAEKEKLIKELINLKAKATEETRKAKLLGIEAYPMEKKNINSDDIEDEEDNEFKDEIFEDVEVELDRTKEINSSTIPSSKLPPLQRIFPLSFEPNMIKDTTYNGPPSIVANTNKQKRIDKGKQKENTQRKELLERAPVVEWGEDLYYWDKKNVQFNTSGIEKNHRFMGVGEGTNEMPEHLLEELRKRAIYYKSEAPKEIQACRYPLHNGGLCPRKDLVTCPFHGQIIPRDELGRPLNPNDVSTPTTSLDFHVDEVDRNYGETSKPPDSGVMNNLWELIEADVMDQTGHEKIIMTKHGRRKEEKPKTALIDIKKKPSTSYTRLKRVIDSSKTKKMVKEAIEYEREMKSRNKQASNWR